MPPLQALPPSLLPPLTSPRRVQPIHPPASVNMLYVPPLQALPQWKALALARYPVAIEVADCSKVSAILLGAKIRTDEDRKRMLGPGLLVFEVGSVPPADMSPTGFYLAAAGASESVELVDGAALIAAGKTGVATMLFLCRWVQSWGRQGLSVPPDRAFWDSAN